MKLVDEGVDADSTSSGFGGGGNGGASREETDMTSYGGENMGPRSGLVFLGTVERSEFPVERRDAAIGLQHGMCCRCEERQTRQEVGWDTKGRSMVTSYHHHLLFLSYYFSH